MRHLTLRERDSIPIGKDDGLDEMEAAAFARIQPRLPAGCLTWQHRALRFGPFCGVLCAGDVTVELLPKIDEESGQNQAARGLLVGMLHATKHLEMAPAGESTLGQQRVHLLDQFIQDFCLRVSAALRGGAIAQYLTHEENLSALRGRLILGQHLRRNAFDRSHLYCGFDERTVDNAHNRALKAVLLALHRRAIGARTRASVAGLLHRFDGVAEQHVTPRDIARLTFDRLTDYWEPIFERGRWLLEGLFPDVRTGNIDGTCLLFNMERLFEAFIGVKLRQAWQRNPEHTFRVQLQGPQKSLARSDEGDAFRLRPDVTVFRNGEIVRIVDAKWKRLDQKSLTHGLAPADVYQIAAYSSRYQCARVALVYPSVSGYVPGLVGSYSLAILGAPTLDIYALDVQDLVHGGSLPLGLRPWSLRTDRITGLAFQAAL